MICRVSCSQDCGCTREFEETVPLGRPKAQNQLSGERHPQQEFKEVPQIKSQSWCVCGKTRDKCLGAKSAEAVYRGGERTEWSCPALTHIMLTDAVNGESIVFALESKTPKLKLNYTVSVFAKLEDP